MSKFVTAIFARSSRNRGMVAVCLLVVAIGAAAVGSWIFLRPPDPATASREAIMRWVVLSDVTQQPLETQIALVDRLERELQQGLEPSAGEALSDARQKVLTRNISALKRLWFVERVRQYHLVASAQRERFMDERIATLLAWSNLEELLRQDETNAQVAGSAVAEFFNEIEAWMTDETDSTLQAKMETAVHEGVLRWLVKHSLTHQPMSVRTELAVRIARQLDAGLQLSQLQKAQPSEAKMLRENCELLMEAWLRRQARDYCALPPEKQPAFITRNVESVSNWGVLELLSSTDEGAQTSSPQQGLLRLHALTEQWTERAPNQQRAQIRQLVSAVQAQMLLQMLNPDG